MDCDQVFMVLTRGPFPSGDPCDDLVEAHLETCGSCWQLAEALRPAVEVFQEAVPGPESRDLPGYWGDARPAAAILHDMHRSTARTALARNVQRAATTRSSHFHPSPAESVPAHVFRAVVLAATLTATVIGALLIWQAW